MVTPHYEPDCPMCKADKLRALDDIAASGFQPQPYHADPDEIVTCPSCGKQNDDDARYCDQCGFKLIGAPNVGVL